MRSVWAWVWMILFQFSWWFWGNKRFQWVFFCTDYLLYLHLWTHFMSLCICKEVHREPVLEKKSKSIVCFSPSPSMWLSKPTVTRWMYCMDEQTVHIFEAQSLHLIMSTHWTIYSLKCHQLKYFISIAVLSCVCVCVSVNISMVSV